MYTSIEHIKMVLIINYNKLKLITERDYFECSVNYRIYFTYFVSSVFEWVIRFSNASFIFARIKIKQFKVYRKNPVRTRTYFSSLRHLALYYYG